MADHKTIARIVAEISAAYPNWNVTEYTIEVYYQDLKDIPDDELMVAAQHCRTENGRRFAPSVGEIRGAVAELRGISSNIPTAFEAWGEVLEQFKYTGYYNEPKFSHPIIAETVRLMGWKELCVSENQIADRARFVQCFDQLVARAERDEMILPDVRGYLVSNGAALPEPVGEMKLLADKLNVRKK